MGWGRRVLRLLQRVALVLLLVLFGLIGGDIPVVLSSADGGPDLYCPSPKSELTVIALGDTRTPYHPIKHTLLDAIIEERPDVVLHLGDMVADTRDEHWARFDREEGRIMAAGIPMLPVMGNHEHRGMMYRGNPLKPLFHRFPELNSSRWYRYLCGPLELVVIDTEDTFIPDGHQSFWFKRHLRSMPNGKARIVAMHRPAITGKPRYTHWHADALIEMVRPNPNYGGAGLVLASHVHNYERFQRGGSIWVVSGGGGAPAYHFPRRSDDLFKKATFPNYHYLRIKVKGGRMDVEMVRMDPEGRGSRVADSFSVVESR
ncbi:MAG: metallophosphoesterase [Magnetococcales bacterium]|nr:metallophosphoesterase [Magnetococcales bacterium]